MILTAVESYSLVINKMSWIADFSTTQYMCCDLFTFSLIKMFNNRPSIRKVSEVMYTQEIEMINLQLKNSNEKSWNIILMNVYLMSNMKLNLFSIKMAKTKEISVKIKDELLHLKNKVKNMLDHAVCKDKLYYL